MLLFAAAWGIGVIVYVWNDEPTVEMTYAVLWPDQPPTRTIAVKDLLEEAGKWHKKVDAVRPEDFGAERIPASEFGAISGVCGSEDMPDWENTTTSKGTSVRLEFCFIAQKSASGKMLIPYRIDRKAEKWWGEDNNQFLPEIREYRERVTSEFQLSKADSEWADSQWWPARWKQLREGAIWFFSGWIVLWILTFVIGWIVRGFMGIPMGHDQRSPSK